MELLYRCTKVDEPQFTPLELTAVLPPCHLCPSLHRPSVSLTYSADIRQILEHIGVEPEPPHITPARGPPLWDGAEAQAGEGVEPAPDWDEAAQPAPDFEVDQRISW